MHPSESELVLLQTCADNAEATALRMLLEAHGIYVLIQGENHRQLVGNLGTFIELRALVRPEDLERARALLSTPAASDGSPEELPAAEDAPEPEEEERPRKRRRWVRAMALMVLVGPMLVMLLPLVSGRLPSAQERGWAKHLQAGDTAFESRLFPQAEASYREAITAAKDFPPQDTRLGAALLRLGAVLQAQGRLEDAEPFLQQALAAMEQALGKSDPALAEPLALLARLHEEQQRLAEAEAGLRRIVELCQQDPSQQKRLAQTLGSLGMVYQARGDLDGAALVLQDAADLTEKLQGPTDVATASAQARLAEVRMALKRHEEARGLYEKALPILEAAHGTEHPDVVSLSYSLGSLYVWMEEPARAQPLFERVLAADEKAYGKEHPELVEALFRLGLVHREQGHGGQAVALLERAVRICDKHPNFLYHSYTDLLGAYARLLRVENRPSEAETVEARLRALPTVQP
jgi:tetratricopeptide (TPR) repeat protein